MEELALEREDRRGLAATGWSGCAPTSPTSEEELRGLESRWEREKAALEGFGELRKQIDELRIEAERLQREGDLGRRREILYGRIPELEKQLEQAAAGRGSRSTRPDGQRGGRPRRDRRGRRGLDRHPDRPAARGRDRQAAADGGRSSASGWSASGPR